MCWIATLEYDNEGVDDAINEADPNDSTKEYGLPSLSKQAKKEQAKRDFEKTGGKNIENFAELNEQESGAESCDGVVLGVLIAKCCSECERTVRCVQKLLRSVKDLEIVRMILTKDAIIATSSQPGDFVIRNRAHNRRLTANHARTSRIMATSLLTCPRCISSWRISSADFAMFPAQRWLGEDQMGLTRGA